MVLALNSFLALLGVGYVRRQWAKKGEILKEIFQVKGFKFYFCLS